MPDPIKPRDYAATYDGLMAACCAVFPVAPGQPTVRTRGGMAEIRSTEADILCGWLVGQFYGELRGEDYADLLEMLDALKLESTLARWRKEAAWSCDCGEVVPPDVSDCPSCQPSMWCRCGEAKREDAAACDACAADAADARGER